MENDQKIALAVWIIFNFIWIVSLIVTLIKEKILPKYKRHEHYFLFLFDGVMITFWALGVIAYLAKTLSKLL